GRVCPSPGVPPAYAARPAGWLAASTGQARRSRNVFTALRTSICGLPSGHLWLSLRSSRRERRMVAREGLEPSKAQGRQIYSLLRLTASLPRRCVVWMKALCPSRARLAHIRCRQSLAEEGGKSWRRDLNPRPADYKSAALPDRTAPAQKKEY